MHIIDLDEKNGIVEIQIEDINDLFVLWNFIRPGDYLEAMTTRKIKFESGESERIKMRLKIQVERVSFHEFLEVLRVSGRIIEGPEKFISTGSYHTIQVKRGMKIRIVRPGGLTATDIEILKEADILSRLNPIIIIAVERDEATIGMLYGSKLRIVGDVHQHIAYKGSSNAKALKHIFFKKIADIVLQILKDEPHIAGIIIAGPGIIKEELMEFLKARMKRNIRIVLDQAGSGTVSGIYEILRRGTALRISSEMLIAQDIKDYEEFLEHLGRGDNLAVYGIEQVEQAVNWGAAEKILVNIDLVNNPDQGIRGRTLRILEASRKINCRVRIISRIHPLHDNIDNFGGIIAILRFRIRWGDAE